MARPSPSPARRRSPPTTLRWLTGARPLLGIFLLALLVRVIYILQQRANPQFASPLLDPAYHDQWAWQLATGTWKPEGPFFRAPLYPIFLAAIYRLVGHDYLAARMVQAIVGALSCVLTYAIGARTAALSQPAEVREANVAAIPDATRRAARRSVIEHGVRAPEFAGALGYFLGLLDAMESALGSQSWLTHDRFGLADAAALPYVLRLEHLAMTPLLSEAARPRVADWLARVKSRPSFAVAVAAWAPAPILQLFRTQGEAVWADVEPLTRRA